jgi:hypothetical protein
VIKYFGVSWIPEFCDPNLSWEMFVLLTFSSDFGTRGWVWGFSEKLFYLIFRLVFDVLSILEKKIL